MGCRMAPVFLVSSSGSSRAHNPEGRGFKSHPRYWRRNSASVRGFIFVAVSSVTHFWRD